jgi:hypothetical protein
VKRSSVGLLAVLSMFISPLSNACGGFFCSLTPIAQAGEQIIFKQENGNTTTMVRILYTGEAEDFAWVLPVPATPQLSIGSDITFTELEISTRPQFNLQRTGTSCLSEDDVVFTAAADGTTSPVALPEGVVIEETLEVGPFDAQVISSDDATALSSWLVDNNFDLTERGIELLQPYIDDSMKFVVLKLQNNKSSGDITPIILNYESDKPVIPLRLTAVAAQADMGVLVWILGEARAVPDNFLHVVPNYTRLNWYAGASNAYASYQTLITTAMNEAGGQGFATDLAGPVSDLTQNLTNAVPFTTLLTSLEGATDAEFIEGIWNGTINTQIASEIQTALPLPVGQNTLLYSNVPALITQFTPEQLSRARVDVSEYIAMEVIAPLNNAVDILDDGMYLTRLYTTLSPEEMLVDPTFVFNSDMPQQSQIREANLHTACVDDQNQFTLTLGEGTGRDDEVVLQSAVEFPNTAQVSSQEASWQIAVTSDVGSPNIQTQREFETKTVGDFKEQDSSSGSGGGPVGGREGGGPIGFGIIFMLACLRSIYFLAIKKS